MIEEKLTNKTWTVNGKAEHGFNLKLAHSRGSVAEEIGVASAPRRKVNKRRNDEDIYPEQLDYKKSPLRSLLAWMPRGELLWI